MEMVAQKEETKPFEFNFMELLSSGNYNGLILFPLISKLSVLPVLHIYSSNFRAVIGDLVQSEWEEYPSFGYMCHRHTSRQAFCMYFFVGETEYLSI